MLQALYRVEEAILPKFSGVKPVTGGVMKHYRINKLNKANGDIIKRKDILAGSDREAVQAARDNEDCPICEVLQSGKSVGKIN